MGKIIISTKNSPAAIGPYSQAVNIKGDITFTSGQIPLDPNTGKLVSENFVEQVVQTLDNIRGILEERNCGLSSLMWSIDLRSTYSLYILALLLDRISFILRLL